MDRRRNQEHDSYIEILKQILNLLKYKWLRYKHKQRVIISFCISIVIVFGYVQNFRLGNQLTQKQTLTKSLLHFQQYYNNVVPPFNSDKYRLEKDFIPIVIYVYERPHYFRSVIEALSKVKDIDKTLLIISHDSSMPEMLQIVNNITFCQVKQLFHPTSPLHESDAGGLKEHWWWLQHYLFEELFPEKQNDICFIEEDHEVSPDFYTTLKLLSSIKKAGVVSQASTIALGSYSMDFKASHNVFVTFKGFMNTGYAFNRTVFQYMKKYQEKFDKTDDDWDTSLVDGIMTPNLMPNWQITPELSRVKNIGLDGIHRTQDYAKLALNGSYPISNGENVLLSNIELYELSHDGDPDRIRIHGGPPSRVKQVCKGEECVR